MHMSIVPLVYLRDGTIGGNGDIAVGGYSGDVGRFEVFLVVWVVDESAGAGLLLLEPTAAVSRRRIWNPRQYRRRARREPGGVAHHGRRLMHHHCHHNHHKQGRRRNTLLHLKYYVCMYV